MLVNDAVQRRDRDRIRLAQLLHKLFQSVGRNTAHFNAAYAQHGSGSQRKIKCSGCGLCVLTIHFKEVANLEQNDIVGVIVLDIVVGVQLLSELPFPRLHFIVPSLLFGGEVSAGSDDVVKPCRNLIPVEFYGSAERLLQLHALTAVIFRTAAGYCMRTATGSVLILQKGNFIFGVVSFGEIGIDTTLAALHIPAPCQSGVNFIFGDESSQVGNFGHVRLIFAARQRQIGKLLTDDRNFVVVEAHEVTIFAVCREKVCVFVAYFLQEIGVFQRLCKPRSCIGESASAIVVERFQQATLTGFLSEFSVHIPKGFCHLGTLVMLSLHDFHISGVLTGFHQLTDTLRCRLPRDYLCGLGIAGASAFCKVDAIFGIPCGKFTVIGLETGTAVELFFQNSGDFFHGFLLLERSNHNASCIAFVAAQAEHMVNIFLCKGKSEGCRSYTLRFIDKGHLLLFRGERGQIEQTELFACI